MGSWVFGADTTALAFTQAEVSILFPAPLSRRALIRLQAVSRADRGVDQRADLGVRAAPRRRSAAVDRFARSASGCCSRRSTCTGLARRWCRSSWREHGATGARRHRWSIAAFALIGACGRRESHRSPRGARQRVRGRRFLHRRSRRRARVCGRPCGRCCHSTRSIAPTFAATDPRVGARACCRRWPCSRFTPRGCCARTPRSRTRRSRRRPNAHADSRRCARGARSLRRRPHGRRRRGVDASARGDGPAAFAIFWKNMLCLRRTVQLRLFIGPVVMSIAFGAAFSSDGAATRRDHRA